MEESIIKGAEWLYKKSWSTNLTAKYQAIEFENGSEGDSDWYLYDADESGVSIGFLYHW